VCLRDHEIETIYVNTQQICAATLSTASYSVSQVQPHAHLNCHSTCWHIPALWCTSNARQELLLEEASYEARFCRNTGLRQSPSLKKITCRHQLRSDCTRVLTLLRIPSRVNTAHYFISAIPAVRTCHTVASLLPKAPAGGFLPQPYGITLLDISTTHPRCATYVQQTAQLPGATAATTDRDKTRVTEGHALGG
jgi:hypothetical protein